MSAIKKLNSLTQWSEYKQLHFVQLFKFAVIGGLNTIIYTIQLLAYIELLAFPKLLANMMAMAITLLLGFVLNKYWTFGNSQKNHVRQGAGFLLVYISSYCFSQLIFYIFAVRLNYNYLLISYCTIPITMIWNYIWLHSRVFKHTHAK